MATGFQFTAFSGTGTGAGNQLGGDGGIVTTIKFSVVMASTGTVNFEHTVDGINWFPVAVKDCSTVGQTFATSCTASGIFEADAAGDFGIRPNVVANGSGIVIIANKVLG